MGGDWGKIGTLQITRKRKFSVMGGHGCPPLDPPLRVIAVNTYSNTVIMDEIEK